MTSYFRPLQIVFGCMVSLQKLWIFLDGMDLWKKLHEMSNLIIQKFSSNHSKKVFQSFQKSLPFINSPPTRYDTIFSALRVASEKCILQDQKTCFVTFDQPLYLKAKDILASCDDPELKSVVLRLGGFHLLMPFMGSVGVVMSGSGLEELFSTIYAENSVDRLMSGHAYSRAVRAPTLTYLALSTLVLEIIEFTEDDKAFMENILTEFNRSIILTA